MALKPKQMRLAELMAAEPELTNEEYAERIGVNPSTVYAYKKLEEFQDYLHECCVKEFKAAEKLAIRRLIENADSGNQRAIEYLLNYLNYQPATKIEANVATDINITVEE